MLSGCALTIVACGAFWVSRTYRTDAMMKSMESHGLPPYLVLSHADLDLSYPGPGRRMPQA
jgi:hypothetical protein